MALNTDAEKINSKRPVFEKSSMPVVPSDLFFNFFSV